MAPSFDTLKPCNYLGVKIISHLEFLKKCLFGLALIGAHAAWAVDVYQPSTNQLTIPMVKAGEAYYANVRIEVGDIISIGGTEISRAYDLYDFATGHLNIPLVVVGANFYKNVTITVKNILSVEATSPTPFTVGSTVCKTLETSNGLMACVVKNTLNGQEFIYPLATAGATLDLNQDKNSDLILSQTWNVKNSFASKLDFFLGVGNGVDYVSHSPQVVNGEASAIFTRNILTGDFNGDGVDDFYLADATEIASDPSGFPFNGTEQYVYLSKGGGYVKTPLEIGSKTVHGAASGLKSNDGFSLLLNTPWNDRVTSTNIFNVVNVNTDNKIVAKKFELHSPGSYNPYSTYIAAIDIGKTGRKDLVKFTYTNEEIQILRNDGKGNFVLSKTMSHWTKESHQVENVAVADFNNDGYEDLLVMYIDRTGQTKWNTNASTLRVLINDRNGGFIDATSDWLGAEYQRYIGGFFDFYALDVNSDGLIDIAFTTQVFSDDIQYPNVTTKLIVLKNTGSRFQKTEFSNLTWIETLKQDQWMPASIVPLKGNVGPGAMFAKNGVLYTVKFK